MKFTKFGKAVLMAALAVGIIFGVSSCVESYTVGYLFVTGTVTSGSGSNGILSGFKIDHNTGYLTPMNGLPVSTGGANPVRAALTLGSRFLYVLNAGANASGGATCTTTNPCLNSNVTEFAIGGDGVLTPQETFYTQGVNPFRMAVDTSGNYLLVLDHDAPDSNSYTGKNATSNSCTLALGTSTKSCGDVTVFAINSTTGRLSVVLNAQVSSASGSPLTYFPVPANPIDFVLNSGYVLTLSGNSTTGDVVFPYTYISSSGQLTITQNTAQPLGIYKANSLVVAGGVVYIPDSEPPNPNPNGATAQILPYTIGSNGALQVETGGAIADDSTLSGPYQVILESKGKFLYVANEGANILGPNSGSGLAGYFLTTTPAYQLSFIAGEPFGSGSGPQCIVEDPSDQFIYTANYNDSTVTGRVVDPNSGVLNPLRVPTGTSLTGPPTWCLVDGRTD